MNRQQLASELLKAAHDLYAAEFEPGDYIYQHHKDEPVYARVIEQQKNGGYKVVMVGGLGGTRPSVKSTKGWYPAPKRIKESEVPDKFKKAIAKKYKGASSRGRMSRQAAYTKDWAKKTNYRGINMELVGSWQDLAAYYRGSDGNYWKYQRSFVNMGPKIRNTRGKTLDGKDIETLPDLSKKHKGASSRGRVSRQSPLKHLQEASSQLDSAEDTLRTAFADADLYDDMFLHEMADEVHSMKKLLAALSRRVKENARARGIRL